VHETDQLLAGDDGDVVGRNETELRVKAVMPRKGRDRSNGDGADKRDM
jgi:hypothetical protein